MTGLKIDIAAPRVTPETESLRAFAFRLFAGDALAGGNAFGLIAWLVKLAVAGTLLGVFEMSIAKMRVFRVPNFLGIALMLGLLGVLLRFVSEGM